ncbi:MAG: Ig-like domain-containing protein, partial [Desulfobacteraceae bacterium]
MKAIYIFLVAICIIFISSSAFAEWDDSDLILAIFNEDWEGDEIVINLGDVSEIDFAASDVVLSSGQVTVADWADLKMGVVAYTSSTYTEYFATTSTLEPGVDMNSWNNFNTNISRAYNNYHDLDADADGLIVHSATDGGSEGINWGALMNQKFTVPGSYAGINADISNGEAALDALGAGGSVKMYLYKYTGIITLDNDDDGHPDTPYIGIIEIKANGDIVLNPQNNPPVAKDDDVTINEDMPVTINPAGNDEDDDDPTEALFVSSIKDHPDNGKVVLNDDNTVTYTPDVNYHGPDSFTYYVSDGKDVGTETGTVNIIVESVNDPPDANDDSLSVDEGGTATQAQLVEGDTLLSNDTDVDSVNLTVNTTAVSGPSHGSLTLNTDGTFSYTHDGSETTTDSFEYEVFDGEDTDQAAVSITINPINDAPVVSGGGLSVDFTEDGSDVPITVGVSVSDVDSNIQSATVVLSGENFENGIDELIYPVNISNISGSFTGNTLTLTGDDIPANYQAAIRSITFRNSSQDPTPGARTITYRVRDVADEYSNEVTTGINVIAVNDAPVVHDIEDESKTITQGESFIGFDLDNKVDDLDHNDNEISWSSSVETISGSLTVTVNINPDTHEVTYSGYENQIGKVNVTFTASDGSDSDSGVAVLTITEADAPQVSNIPDQNKEEDHNFDDIHLDNFLNYAGNIQDVIWTSDYVNHPLTVQIQNRIATVTSPEHWHGSEKIKFIATAGGKSDFDEVTFSKTSVNDAPVVSGGTSVEFIEDGDDVHISESITVSDVDSNIQSATVMLSGGNFENGIDELIYPTKISNISGSFSENTMTLTGVDTPENYQAAIRSIVFHNGSQDPTEGVRTITYKVRDDDATDAKFSAEVTTEINVNAVNDAPVIIKDMSQTITQG